MDTNKRRMIFSKVFGTLAGTFVLYNIILNLVAVLLTEDLGLVNIRDQGIIMIISVLTAFLISSRLVQFIKIKEIVNYKKVSISPLETLRYFGLMLICNIVISLIVKTILDLLSIKSLDVSAIISNNLTVWMVLYAVIIGPIIEELLYRGYLLQPLSKFNKKSALIFSSIIFAISHGNLEQSLSVMGIALILGYIGQNISFKQALILHILNNLSSVIVTFLIKEYGETHIISLIYVGILYAIMAYSIIQTTKKYRREKVTKVDQREGIEGLTEEEIEHELLHENIQFKLSKSIYFWIILIFYLLMMISVYLTTKSIVS